MQISGSFYDEGRAIYEHGCTIRVVAERIFALEQAERAEHQSAEMGGGDPEPRHQAVSERYRFAGQSLTLGFAEGALADLRLIAGQRRGQRA